jgi:hypothetical protein
VSAGSAASFVGGEVAGERVRRVVEVDERVADGVAERVVDGAATLVPDSAFVEGDGGGRGGA